eukprot:GFYU01032755.1.p2 GENE.GFYU01032755.1~~GFYU01032755.1.p2  ORF type:complete len:274 (+),score=80.10 GFYU01032755.1:2-823(+)
MFAVMNGIVGAWMGGFGHNWIHQHKYRLYAYCLDVIGLSSESWLREHLLQHHMFTNTPLDAHFHGTDPFLVVDPTRERAWLQKWVCPVINPIILFCGIPGNYTIHTVRMFMREEDWTIGKILLPMQVAWMCSKWGWWGLAMMFTQVGVNSVYYFTIALANHNTEEAWDVDKRNNVSDWAEAQLQTCCDVDVGLSFLQSIRYLWLNYHTVHHLFPHTDMSHHPAIQRILLETCAEMHVPYMYNNFWQMYKEMVVTFHHPRHLGAEIMLYAGGGA